MSGFFASQQSADAPRRKPRAPLSPIIKQKADRFESLSNEHLPGAYLPLPPTTVRLVSSSPSPESTPSRSNSGNSKKGKNSKKGRNGKNDGNSSRPTSASQGPHRPRSALLVKETTSLVSPLGISAQGREGEDVSDIPAWTTHQPQIVEYGSSLTLVANDSGHELPKLALEHDHWDLTSSSGDYSRSTTLNENDLAAQRNNSNRYGSLGTASTVSQNSSRFSSLGTASTTSRRTITPVEVDDQDPTITRSDLANALPTVEEAPLERKSTVREVPPSDSSSTDRPHSGPSDTASADPSSSEPSTQIISRKSLKRAYSAGSLRRSPSIFNLREVSTSPASHYDPQRDRPNWSAISADAPTSSPNFISYNADNSSSPTRQGAAIHAANSIESISDASSPNFLAYGSDSNHSTSGGDLNNATSLDSLNSRLHHVQRTLNPSTSWASLDEGHDTLPPLNIPKKRAKYTSAPMFDNSKYTSAPIFDNSAFAGVGPSYVGEDMDDEIDTLPYPKRPFSSHLSTIASESDRHSRSASRHMSHLSRLSHFSLGSGVMTGDEESFIATSPTIAERRRRSLPSDSMVSAAPSSAFDEYGGDLTTFREASAIPQPLFRAGQPTMTFTSKKYNGPLPPLPPIPMSQSNEDIDTLSALPTPSLKTSKSSRSLKHTRSKSTPSHSRQPSQISTTDSVNRHSAGSSIFPTWAKQYYTGNAVLQNKMSMASLNGQQPSRTTTTDYHARNESSWTERSGPSRLGTGYSQRDSGSQVSSHFLPSIFRPKTWMQQRPTSPQKSTKSGKSGRSLRSVITSRSRPQSRHQPAMEREQQEEEEDDDDMNITPNPLSHHPTNSSYDDILPSGQPKYGKLKDAAPSPPPPTSTLKHHQPPKQGRLKRLPRKYSKQKLWDQMEFPRPMTKDRMSDFSLPRTNTASAGGNTAGGGEDAPKLGRPMRASQRGLKIYETPSFVESLDSLVHERGGRQILCFVLGFVVPVFWMIGALLPLPPRPVSGGGGDVEKGEKGHVDAEGRGGENLVGIGGITMEERRWIEERKWAKARWWRMLNRVMSFVGLGVVGAIIALVVVATT